MKKMVGVLLLLITLGFAYEAQAQTSVKAGGSNRLCWFHSGKDASGGAIKGFRVLWGSATNVYPNSRDVVLGVPLTSVTNPPAPPAGMVTYCSDTFKNLGISDSPSLFFNVLAYDTVANQSGPDGEVNIAPLLVTPPSAPSGLVSH